MVRSSLALGPMPRKITRYRRRVRVCVLVLLTACGKPSKDAPRPEPAVADARLSAVADAASIAATSYPDLGAALKAIVPADARVIGFGEIHARTDSAQVKSSLAHFTT